MDIFSFCTSVDIALARGAMIYPFANHSNSAQLYASQLNAEVASFKGSRYTLSPSSLLSIPPGTRLVMPSLNGSALSVSTGNVPTFAGCLRNAAAVARAAGSAGRHISVIPAGERWKDGSLRPAIEDLLGAGAILDRLGGRRSPEAEIAVLSYRSVKDSIYECLLKCSSGKEMIELGRLQDIALASELDASDQAPRLQDGAYRPTHG